MKIEAVVFDLDGVLWSSPDLHYRALNAALKELGLAEIALDDHLTRFNGLPTRVKLKMLDIPPERVEEVNALKQRHTAVLMAESVTVDTGVVALLQALMDRGYRMGCASNAVRATVDAAIRGIGAHPFMEITLSNEDVANPKPHPDIYSEACRLLGLQPPQVLVVEDNANGWRACLEAGCRLCVVRNPSEVTIRRVLESIRDHESVGTYVPGPGRHD